MSPVSWTTRHNPAYCEAMCIVERETVYYIHGHYQSVSNIQVLSFEVSLIIDSPLCSNTGINLGLNIQKSPRGLHGRAT